MANQHNPWQDPPSTRTLVGDLASFEINGNIGPQAQSGEGSGEDAGEVETPEPEDVILTKALGVISQQAALINKLIGTLGKSAK
jgi:hypothetical protein